MGKKVYRNKGRKENVVISIAGAHGVGKSTIFRLLRRKTGEDYKFKFFRERYIKNPPFPFGSSDKQTAFRSEIHFLQQLIRRNKNVWNYDNRYNGRIIILDRTPLCVLIYSKSLNLKEKDYNLILDMYNSVKWREDFIIYLTAKPENILKRIVQRGSLEKERSTWNEYENNYLLTILSYYNQFLFSKNEKQKVRIVNTNDLRPGQVLKHIEGVITELTGHSFEKIVHQPKSQLDLLKFIK